MNEDCNSQFTDGTVFIDNDICPAIMANGVSPSITTW